jgi:hypothetical protein
VYVRSFSGSNNFEKQTHAAALCWELCHLVGTNAAYLTVSTKEDRNDIRRYESRKGVTDEERLEFKALLR